MARRIVFFVLVLIFMLLGLYAGIFISSSNLVTLPSGLPELKFGIMGLGALVGLVAGLLLVPWVIRGSLWVTAFIEQWLHRTPTQDLIMGSVGLILGLIIANLLGSLLSFLGPIGKVIWLLITVLLGYLGLSVSVKKREEILGLFGSITRFGKEKPLKGEPKMTNLKILDTSVIIDGRISDLCESGFIEGTLLVPGFVLEELRHIADSSDLLKRNRGRRGLDILNKMRKDPDIKVQIYDNNKGLEENAEVDTKLVKLGQKLGGKIMTNDYNLNKVAELHGVRVLNINELANAVKPVVLPGEEMVVQVVKDGKESGQGIGYLDDGTMIVVDGGRRYIGQTINVVVTSVLQTAAGRMIFAKPRLGDRKDNGLSLNEVNFGG
ncbi:MAG: twitching motility protein PilT [Peptococcaceae bacterium BRH_c4b]|nr:MAG: twitching motility protein PilT [Peptococcaceae bacterium BRH_c4b]